MSKEFPKAKRVLEQRFKEIESRLLQIEQHLTPCSPVPPAAHPEILRILTAVGEYFGCSRADLVGPRGPAKLALARHVAATLCARITHCTGAEISAAFKRERSFLQWAKKVVRNVCDTEPKIAAEVRELEEKLRNGKALSCADFAKRQ